MSTIRDEDQEWSGMGLVVEFTDGQRITLGPCAGWWVASGILEICAPTIDHRVTFDNETVVSVTKG